MPAKKKISTVITEATNRLVEWTLKPTRSHANLGNLALQAVSESRHDGIIGHPLSKPITVSVKTDEAQNVPGIPVRFEILEGDGSIENKKVALIKTDEKGRASASWIMGRVVGRQKLRVSIPSSRTKPLEFVSLARPHIPNIEMITSKTRDIPIFA